MARMTIAPEHKKYFQINGYISFEGLVPSQELKELLARINARRSDLPGLNQENLARALPSVLGMATKLAPFAAALIDKKPLRLAHDSFIEDIQKVPQLDEREIGLLLSFSGTGLFFTDPSQLYNEKEACYLLFVFTPNFVNKPTVYK